MLHILVVLLEVLLGLLGIAFGLLIAGVLSWRMKWAVFVSASKRPAILNKTHADWPGFLKKVPRFWVAFFSDTPPVKLLGNAKSLKPIPDPGEWMLQWPAGLTLQTKGRKHLRLDVLRKDDVDNYWTAFSAAYHDYSKQGKQ